VNQLVWPSVQEGFRWLVAVPTNCVF